MQGWMSEDSFGFDLTCYVGHPFIEWLQELITSPALTYLCALTSISIKVRGGFFQRTLRNFIILVWK